MAGTANPQELYLSPNGDFDAWRRQVSIVLAHHRLDHCLNRSAEDNNRGDRYETAGAFAAVHMVRVLVSPPLLFQVDFPVSFHLSRLMSRLKALTQPFRFLDLPVEIRHITYRYVISDGNSVSVLLAPEWRSKRRSPHQRVDSSAITRVSRQIRIEALPLFYTHTVFTLNARTQFRTIPRGCDIAEAVRRWVEHIPAEQVRNLRKVVLKRKARLYMKNGNDRSYMTNTMTFSFSTGAGLTFESAERLRGGSATKIDKHMTWVGRTCKLLNLNGEVIILALTSHDGLFGCNDITLNPETS